MVRLEPAPEEVLERGRKKLEPGLETLIRTAPGSSSSARSALSAWAFLSNTPE